jgi:hypothetical protein
MVLYLMELRLNSPISEPINLQLKCQARTFNHHLECEVQIVELHASRRRQASEQALWYSTEVCSERAHVYEIASIGIRWFAIGV